MSDLFDELGATEKVTYKERGTESVKQRNRKRRRTAILSFFTVMIVSAAAVIVIPQLFTKDKALHDYPGPGTGSVTVVIPEGATGRDMANILVDNGVVATAEAFVDAYNADSRANGIQPGTYNLRLEMSGVGALTALLDPASKAEIKITIPEGFTTWQVYARLAEPFGMDAAEIEQIARGGTIGLPDVAGGEPEGWFAPLTYTFTVDTTVEQALATMVQERVDELRRLGVAEADWERVLTIASIVEREGRPDDYGKVARVIANRQDPSAESVGLLQMDSTVMYGLGIAGGVPNQEQLDTDTPYNTYLHQGLPPTPIGAAGDAAIQAALNPEPGNWLYFVTINLDTGETLFSSTNAEHDANVAQFRAWCDENPGSCG